MYLKLMIPGPIELENETLEQMGGPNRVHYGDEWVQIHNDTIDLLRQVFKTTGKVFMMPGSGSLGLDAAVHSTFAPGDRVALGVNGHFGHRLKEVMEANGIVPVLIEATPGQPLDPEAFARILDQNPDIVALAAVHLETSTAVLNPIREIAAAGRTRNRLVMADVVSSLAGTPLEMDEWGIDLCISASQKGLGAAAGLGIVAVAPKAWDKIVQNADHARSWYLDLRRWQWYVENWADWHPFPITMPTNTILGLHAALRSLFREGLEARFRRYEAMAVHLRRGLEALGLPLFVPEELMAPVLTAAYSFPSVPASELTRYMEREHHIKITGGFGDFKERVIRIGHMGGAITDADIDLVLNGLSEFHKTNPRAQIL